MLVTLFILLAVIIVGSVLYMKQPKFGKAPSGSRLEFIKQSANYRDGKFVNLSHTPQLTEGYPLTKVLYTQLFKRVPGRKPSHRIPSVKRNLKNVSLQQNILVWFGHSSYYIQTDGKRILVDPVFSGNASPLPGTNKAFEGTDVYSVDDFPDIDYLFITHDHYDHLDYSTVVALKKKVHKVVCSLGVGSHLEYWGYHKHSIIEKDWYESVALDHGFIVYVESARHFAGRGFSRNNTLWCSYLLQTPSMKIYLGGDSGYDSHYADIGKKHGPVDLAILENGQYNLAWKYIHQLPQEALKAAHDLKAKRLFPVHNSKFAMANHPWDEPLSKITETAKQGMVPLLIPMIGEIVDLNHPENSSTHWWTDEG